MLVLARKLGESLVIADSIKITVLQVERGNVRLGVQAPPQIKVLREELQVQSDGIRPRRLGKDLEGRMACPQR